MNGLHALGGGQRKEIGYRVVAGREREDVYGEWQLTLRTEYFWAKSGESRRTNSHSTVIRIMRFVLRKRRELIDMNVI
jgi:hypothetical protein